MYNLHVCPPSPKNPKNDNQSHFSVKSNGIEYIYDTLRLVAQCGSMGRSNLLHSDLAHTAYAGKALVGGNIDIKDLFLAHLTLHSVMACQVALIDLLSIQTKGG